MLELTYTAWDLQAFARDLGHDGPPFAWGDPAGRPAIPRFLGHLATEIEALGQAPEAG